MRQRVAGLIMTPALTTEDFDGELSRTGRGRHGLKIKNGRILLMRRVKNGREYFVFPGGSVEKGETLEAALAREIKEELSLDPIIDRLLLKSFNREFDQEEYYYLVRKFSGQLALGGEEKDRMTDYNQYYPEWHDIGQAFKLRNLYPAEVKKLLLAAITKVVIINIKPKFDQQLASTKS